MSIQLLMDIIIPNGLYLGTIQLSRLEIVFLSPLNYNFLRHQVLRIHCMLQPSRMSEFMGESPIIIIILHIGDRICSHSYV